MDKRTDYIEKFQREIFAQEDEHFQAGINQLIEQNSESYIEDFKKSVKCFLTEIHKMQATVMEKVGCVEISFLRASVDSDKLLMAFEAYDEMQDIGRCLIDMRSSAGWFTKEWEQFKERLNELRERQEWCRYVNYEDIRIMLQGAFYQLYMKLIYLFKYSLQTCDTWEEYQNIRHTDIFYISVGEFRDKQKLIFVDRAEFDIFLSGINTPLCYGKFSDKVYKQKVFGNLNLKGSKFINCRFEKCDIQKVELQDSIFVDCIFYQCTFQEADLSGSMLTYCRFDECDLGGMDWYVPISEESQDVKDVYRKTILADCTLQRSYVKRKKIDACMCINTELKETVERES